MYVRSLKLRNYRNYSELELALQPGINIFLGPNAQGKTNVVEAVYYASLGHSHRTHLDTELIRWDAGEGCIILDFDRRGVMNHLEFQFSRAKRRRVCRAKSQSTTGSITQRRAAGPVSRV